MKPPFTLCACATLVALAGCASIEPAYVAVADEHVSHVSQHFGPHPTSYGFDAVEVQAHWDVTPKLTLDVGEGAIVDQCVGAGLEKMCGSLAGSREVFTGRVAYKLWQR